MRRTIALFILIAFLCSITACKDTAGIGVNASSAPTEVAHEGPTADSVVAESTTPNPTIEPVVDATAEPTTVQTAEPVTVVLCFDKCAEEVLRLVPCYAGENNPYLPEDADNNAVRYCIDNGFYTGPEIFALDGDTIIVGHLAPTIYDLKVFKNGRFVRRVVCDGIDHNGSNFTVALGSVLFKEIGAFSLETGETIYDTTTPYIGNFAAFLYNCAVGAQHYDNGDPAFIVCETMGREGNYIEEYEFYRLSNDMYRIWHKSETICRMLPEANGTKTTLLLNNGKELILPDIGYILIGRDTEGNLYLNKIGETEKLLKIAADGQIASEVEIPYGDDDRWNPCIIYQLGADGSVYAAASLKDAYIVWKITM